MISTKSRAGSVVTQLASLLLERNRAEMEGMCELLHTGDVFWPSSVEPHREGPMVRILFPPAERWYGAGGEGDGTIVAGKYLTECPDAPAERLEQVPRRLGPR
jgi:hypothetical protein